MVTNRMQKFDELVQKELAVLIREMYPDHISSITQVHVSKDLSFAKVWISSIVDVDDLVKSLRDNRSALRKMLSKKIIARRVPSLYFVADKTEEKAEHIDNLLNTLKDE